MTNRQRWDTTQTQMSEKDRQHKREARGYQSAILLVNDHDQHEASTMTQDLITIHVPRIQVALNSHISCIRIKCATPSTSDTPSESGTSEGYYTYNQRRT